MAVWALLNCPACLYANGGAVAVAHWGASLSGQDIVKLFQDVRGMAFARPAHIIAGTKSESKYAVWIKAGVFPPKIHSLQHAFERLAAGVRQTSLQSRAIKGVP
jgi:hypothetical protein